MLTRMLIVFLRIFKRADPQEDADDLPITDPVCMALQPPVRRVPTALVSQATRYPGVLARSFALGQLDLLDGRLVLSTVVDTRTRRLPPWSKSDENEGLRPTDW